MGLIVQGGVCLGGVGWGRVGEGRRWEGGGYGREVCRKGYGRARQGTVPQVCV